MSSDDYSYSSCSGEGECVDEDTREYDPREGGGAIAPDSQHGSSHGSSDESEPPPRAMRTLGACDEGNIKAELGCGAARDPMESASDAHSPPVDDDAAPAKLIEVKNELVARDPMASASDAHDPPVEDDALPAKITETDTYIVRVKSELALLDARGNARDTPAKRAIKRKHTRKPSHHSRAEVDPRELAQVNAVLEEMHDDEADVARSTVIMASCVPSYCFFFVSI
jgi:hypothetical protein